MYYCSNYVTAVLLCVVTMFCWGSWGNTQKLAGKTWRFELFYWDYVLGLVIFALLAGFTAGSIPINLISNSLRIVLIAAAVAVLHATTMISAPLSIRVFVIQRQRSAMYSGVFSP